MTKLICKVKNIWNDSKKENKIDIYYFDKGDLVEIIWVQNGEIIDLRYERKKDLRDLPISFTESLTAKGA